MPMTAEEYSFYNAEAGERFLALSKVGMKAVFIYTENVISDGETVPFSPEDSHLRTVALDGTPMVPALFFTKFYHAALEGQTLTLNGKSVPVAPILDGGISYLPAIETAHALGIAAESFYEDRLIVFGEKAQLDTLREDTDAVTAGAYLIHGKYDPSTFTKEDFAAARAKWRLRLVGSPTINDMNDEVIAEKVHAIDRRCKDKWECMNREADRVILWGDHAPVESEELSIQYSGIAALATAWGTCGSEYYQNDALRLDILDCMRWMYEHMFGEAEIAGIGWRDAHLFNWWYWYIGAPEYITDILFIMEDEIPLETRRQYLKCFEWVYTFMRRGLTRDMALTRICLCTKVALALEDTKHLYEEYVDFDILLGLGETEEGPRVDYVQWTHGFPMNMGYGRLNLDRVLFAAANLAGTRLAFRNPKQYNQFNVVKYMFEPALFKGQGFLMFHGRTTEGCELLFGTAAIAYMLPMLGMFGHGEDAYLKKLIKRNIDTPEALTMLKNQSSIYDCALINEIMHDDSIPAVNDYNYAHAYFTGDRAVQQRNDYAIGIAMSSKREPSYESINNQNKTGWYTGDGSTYLYTNYDRHQHDGVNFLNQNLQIAYRFPGTTEDERERVIRSIESREAWHPHPSFAGSIQFDDQFLSAGMDFESFHFAGPEKDIVDIGYGGGLAVHINDLHAKKAWFCLDHEIVALTAGITSTMDSPVNTIIEHRRIVHDEDYAQFVQVDGKITQLEKAPYSLHLVNPSWVRMEAHAGYVLLSDANVQITRYNCVECKNQPFFELHVAHGKNPTDASCAYAILPYATNEQLEAYAKAPDVEILSNTAAVQAVRHRNLNITGFVFHENGSCGMISTDAPMLLMMGQTDDTITLALSDPTHEATAATITLNGIFTPITVDPHLTVVHENGKTILQANLHLANGRAYRATFQK